VYSTRLLAVHDLSGFSSPYVCPDGYVVVARHADIYQGPSDTINFAAVIFQDVDSVNTVFSAWETAGEGNAYYGHWDGRFIIYPGEAFFLYTDGTLDMSLNGYLLLSP
jgi:hypothetical protein